LDHYYNEFHFFSALAKSLAFLILKSVSTLS